MVSAQPDQAAPRHRGLRGRFHFSNPNATDGQATGAHAMKIGYARTSTLARPGSRTTRPDRAAEIGWLREGVHRKGFVRRHPTKTGNGDRIRSRRRRSRHHQIGSFREVGVEPVGIDTAG